ncbi:uncharacterized protein [Eurosta solidaginis]|uniref:uncharacterized protein n=1 Tax=Eurosta solidaginis TaxID=178769 RepID=UPI003530D675
MPINIRGKEVLEALAEFKEPVTLDEIVRYVAEAQSEPEEKVKKLVEEALNGGVRYGFIQKHNEFYYRVCDAVDAIGDSSEEDEENEIDSAESVESVDSGDIPEPKTKKETKKDFGKRTGVGRSPSQQPSKSRKLDKREKDRRDRKCMDVCSDEGEDEDDFARYEKKHEKSHKCCSDCDGFHRKRSDNDYMRSRSRSASRRR